ncbi:MAG TPA: protoporphyrinogen oxidase [Candidatus Eisenbacteria bacterium]|jgi:oxygen-dependent protoporphyrinogen oxidase
MRVVVVGAGITGLAAAWWLIRGAPAGVELEVLEAEARAGGHAWTRREDGFVVEAGPNGFLHRPDEPQVLELVRELGMESRLIEARPAARRRFVRRGGRLHRAPDGPHTLIASRALSAAGKLRLLREPWVAPAAAGAAEETVFEFARRRVGVEVAEALVDAAVAGISAGDSRRLSVAAAFPRMVEMEREHGSLIRAMFSGRRSRPRLLSFDRGMATLIDALGVRLGSALRAGCPLERIAHDGRRWRLECRDGSTRMADRLVLAVSATRAARLLADLDPALAGTLESIPYAGLGVVALAYRETDLPRALDGYGYLVARSEDLDTLGVVWESSLFEGRAPRGAVLLRAMLGGARRPDLVGLADDDLAARARRELAAVMKITAEPLETWVWRWPRAIAQYEVGHLARIRQARALAARHDGLELCGTSYDGVSFAAAVASARAAAERVLVGFEAAASGEGPTRERPAAMEVLPA